MKLQEIFNQLGTGEFSQISVGKQPPGQINENNYRQVLNHINLGMMALFRRFHLKEGRLILSLQDGQSTYPLLARYAAANRRSAEPVRYILDDAHAPFQDDTLLKITRVLTERELELSLNDVGDSLTCFTPSMTTLVLPDRLVNQNADTPSWLQTARLTVVYRASHPVLSVPIGVFMPDRIDVELPYSHLQALLYFVASRVNNPIGMSNEFHAGNNYAAKYEAECMRLQAEGMESDHQGHNTRAALKGFC